MGYVDKGGVDALTQLDDLRAHLVAELCVEVGERLIHQKHRGVADDGAADRHTLSLAAGQRLGLAVKVLGDVENLGGLDNLTDVGYCITRLRLTVKDPAKVDEEAIKLMGVRGVFVKGKAVQVVIGTRAELVANDINALRKK